MSPKVAIVILVVIALVFIVAVGTGAFSKQNNTHAGWLDAIQGAIHPKPLDMGDVSASPAGCISGNSLTIQPGSTCTYHIKSSSESVRRLSLSGGSVIDVTLTDGDRQFPTQNNIDHGTVDVYGAGGTLVIACVSAFPCVLVPSS